MKDFNDPYILS